MRLSPGLRWFLIALAAFATAAGCPEPPGGDDDDDSTPPQPELLGIGVTPNDPVLAVGESLRFEAKAFYDDYSNAVITDQVSWVTTDERVATVVDGGDDKGRCTAVAAGTTDVVATYSGSISAKVTLTVTGAGVISVELTPGDVEMHVDDTVQISAIANLDDGSSGNVAGSCAWSVDDGAVASVDGTGLVTALAVGSTTVRAAYEGLSIDPVSVEVLDDAIDLPQPDLRIDALDATVQGADVTYSVVVRNTGDGYAGEFNVYLYLDEPGTPDANDPEDAWVWVPGLPAGESEAVMIDLFDVAPGTYQSYALVDPEDVEDESNEGNNAAGPTTVVVDAQVGEPDLVVLDFDGVTDGYYTLYYVEVANLGDGPAGPCDMDLYLDEYYAPSPGQYGDYYVSVPYLDVGESYVWEPELYDGPGFYWDSWIQVDTLDDVAESDEGNNVEWLELWP